MRKSGKFNDKLSELVVRRKYFQLFEQIPEHNTSVWTCPAFQLRISEIYTLLVYV